MKGPRSPEYFGIFSTTIIRSHYRFLFVLSLAVTMIMSVLLVACNNVNAQTLESITQQKLLGVTQIMVGNRPTDIQIDMQIKSM
jgi:hypothetical protein